MKQMARNLTDHAQARRQLVLVDVEAYQVLDYGEAVQLVQEQSVVLERPPECWVINEDWRSSMLRDRRSGDRLRVGWQPTIVVLALLLSGGGCGGPTLTISLKTDPGVAGAQFSLWVEQQRTLKLVGTYKGSQEIEGLGAGNYWIQSEGENGFGEVKGFALGSDDVSVSTTVHGHLLDASRTHQIDFVPGHSASLAAQDAQGVSYTLLLPANAFAGPTTVTLTPFAHPIASFANGNGFEVLSTSQPSAPVFLEVSGGSTDAALAEYDTSRQLWAPVPGTVDDDGVRFYQLAHFSVYVEGHLEVVNAAPAPPTFAITFTDGMDGYARFAALKGLTQEALAWISAQHPNGGELNAGEQALVDWLAGMMKDLADSLVASTCTGKLDLSQLQLALNVSRHAQSLGADASDTQALDAMFQRCLDKMLNQADCSVAASSGDFVAVEVQRRLISYAARSAAIIGETDLAVELLNSLPNCKQTTCSGQGSDLGTQIPPVPPLGTPVGVNTCSSACQQSCTRGDADIDCDYPQDIADSVIACITICQNQRSCGYKWWLTQAGRPQDCQWHCICYGGEANFLFAPGNCED